VTAYYNEHDSYAAQWLRNLIAAGLIPAGDVDTRDIRDVRPDELVRYTQCHFFAGIGVWPYALRRAGWPDDRPIWSGSCPCQPFSTAGAKDGFDDERHLWPHWFWLIRERRPAVVVGEQVAGKDGLGWLDLVSADMEGEGYAFGAADLCAAGIGLDWERSNPGQWLQRAIHDCADPVIRRMLCDFAGWAGQGNIGDGGKHRRQRTYFVGMANTGCGSMEPAQPGGSDGCAQGEAETEAREQQRSRPGDRTGGATSGLADSDGNGWAEAGECEPSPKHDGLVGNSSARRLANSDRGRRQRVRGGGSSQEERIAELGAAGTVTGHANASDILWRDADWLCCRDGSWRAVEPGTFPLDNEVAARVGKLCAYGNALDGETAVAWAETVTAIFEGR
jgi:DNA (cytosine-5)-methyltransferase 1